MTGHHEGRRSGRPLRVATRGGEWQKPRVLERDSRSPLWWSALLSVIVLYPYLAVPVLDGREAEHAALAGHICTLLADLILVCGALVLALDARLTKQPIRASMATGLVVVAVQDAPLVILALLDPDFTTYTVRMTYSHVLVVLVVAAVLAAGLRSTTLPRFGALLPGLVLGLVVLASSLVLRQIDPSPYIELRTVPGAFVALVITAVMAVIYSQLRCPDLPSWAVNRIGAGMLAILAARVWSTVVGAETPRTPAVVGVVVFSAMTLTTVTALLRRSLADTQERSARYAERAAEAEATVKHDREMAHEMRAATAGIVAGAHLLSDGRLPDGPRRQALQRMLDAEASRLSRRLSTEPAKITRVAVDEVIEPLVVAQRALGNQVTWARGGHCAAGRRDNLAEAVNVLLNNAARHAHGRAAAISSRTTDDRVEIWVTDQGPGVDPEVRDHLFEWGVHRVGSPGEGIGLQHAHRLLLEQGGRLELRDRPAAHERTVRGPRPSTTPQAVGATFVITLPRWAGSMRDSTGMAG